VIIFIFCFVRAQKLGTYAHNVHDDGC